MAKISPFSSFRLEDFPTQQAWISTLFFPLNNVLSQVTQALNGQITRGDNIPTFTKTLSGTSLMLPQTFQLAGKFTPTQMVVSQAFKAGSPIAMVGAWSIDGDTITVNKLFELTETGSLPLDASSKYTIVLSFT